VPGFRRERLTHQAGRSPVDLLLPHKSVRVSARPLDGQGLPAFTSTPPLRAFRTDSLSPFSSQKASNNDHIYSVFEDPALLKALKETEREAGLKSRRHTLADVPGKMATDSVK
jgi:hypothetical protein